MYYIGLQTFENQSQCLSAASDIASSGCTPNWQCGWTACVKNGYQYPLAVDSNNCGLKQKGFIICADGALSRKCDYTAQPRLTLTSPNGGEQWALGSPHNITWQQVGVGGPGIKIVLKNTETGTSYLIHDAATYGSYSWTVGDSRESTSLQVPLGNYKIEISSAYSPTGQSQPLSDSSDNYFSIVAPSTQLPLVCSGVVTIDATGQNLVLYDSTPYDIKTDSCRGYRCFVNNKISLACWDKVPNDLWHEDATKCKFYCGVDCVYIPALKEDTCRGRTLPPSIAITSPNGGEQWAQGSDQRITWNVYGFDSISNNPQVEVWIIGTDGTTGRYELPTIQDNVLDGMLFWTIKSGPGPQFSQWVLPPPGKYKVELIAGGYKDYSDNYFTITAP
jgi:hypothetical protein